MPYQPTGRPAGRPPVDNPRRHTRAARFTDDELRQLEAAADGSLSDLLREGALRMAAERAASSRAAERPASHL